MDYLYVLYCVQILLVILYNISTKFGIHKPFFYLNGRDICTNDSGRLQLQSHVSLPFPNNDIDEWGQYVNIELV